MLATLILIYLVHSVSSDAGISEAVIPRCSVSNATGLTFTPVDGYVGRYTAELCSAKDDMGKEWKLKVSFYNTSDYCVAPNYLDSGIDHSTNVEYVGKYNCTGNQTVCISAQFDFIFSACYSIGTVFEDKTTKLDYYYFNISNPYTKQQFQKNQPHVDVIYHKNYISLTWHPGVPPSVYIVELSNGTDFNTVETVHNCTITDRTDIKCYLSPKYGCYRIYLHHIAPWITGIFSRQETVHYDFCRNATSGPEVEGDGWRGWAWVVAGGGAVLALGAGVACLAASTAAAARRRKRLLRTWLTRRNGETAVEAGSPAVIRHVLLLYARECAAAARAVAALKDALQQLIEGQVLDIFAPNVMAEYAGAPGEWVRAHLQRSDVAVLILQSPALHCLYTTHLADTDTGLKLVSPLLGRRVVARVPQFGDTLLQFAMRLITENVRPRDNYRKYYIATISDLPTEILPCIVPYRRYALPAAASLLVRDISGKQLPSSSSSGMLDNFTQLLAEFVDYARDNPDYLMDELMVVDA